MKRLTALILGLGVVTGALAQANVGVSIGISQPGMYGQINIDNYPRPRVINQQPIVIMQSPVREPLYMYVPPGHQKHWEKHCHAYNACGRPVYFVREDWVRERYGDEHRGYEQRGYEQREDGHGRGKGERRKHQHEDH